MKKFSNDITYAVWYRPAHWNSDNCRLQGNHETMEKAIAWLQDLADREGWASVEYHIITKTRTGGKPGVIKCK